MEQVQVSNQLVADLLVGNSVKIGDLTLSYQPQYVLSHEELIQLLRDKKVVDKITGVTKVTFEEDYDSSDYWMILNDIEEPLRYKDWNSFDNLREIVSDLFFNLTHYNYSMEDPERVDLAMHYILKGAIEYFKKEHNGELPEMDEDLRVTFSQQFRFFKYQPWVEKARKQPKRKPNKSLGEAFKSIDEFLNNIGDVSELDQ